MSDHALDSIIGPFCTPTSMAVILATSRIEIMRLIEIGEVLDAQVECPTWQLTNTSVCPESRRAVEVAGQGR